MTIVTKEDLIAALDNLDTASTDELEQLEQQIAETQTAIGNAGSQYESQIAQAEQDTQAATAQYNSDVTAATQARSDAAVAGNAASAIDASAQIAAIQPITGPTVASNSQADIQAALDALVVAINTEIGHIKTALTTLNNPNAVTKLKEAVNHLSTFADKAISATMPPALDTQPEIDQIHDDIDGLVP